MIHWYYKQTHRLYRVRNAPNTRTNSLTPWYRCKWPNKWVIRTKTIRWIYCAWRIWVVPRWDTRRVSSNTIDWFGIWYYPVAMSQWSKRMFRNTNKTKYWESIANIGTSNACANCFEWWYVRNRHRNKRSPRQTTSIASFGITGWYLGCDDNMPNIGREPILEIIIIGLMRPRHKCINDQHTRVRQKYKTIRCHLPLVSICEYFFVRRVLF